jgi:uncharacterized protein
VTAFVTTDETIETPAYLQAFERDLEEWRKLRATPPRPNVPRLLPDTTIMMPMRDGIELYTELFFPQGRSQHLPTVLMRTPYPDSTFPFSARPIELFRTAGYLVAVQSCRGTWRSEGKFRLYQNEPNDGFDCIEWLAAQPWSNGKIGMYGSSYGGSVQWLAARVRPPHLTCIAPQSPAAMFFYETPYIGGVFFKYHVLAWPRLVAKHTWEEMEFDWNAAFGANFNKQSPLYKAMVQSPNVTALQQWHQADPEFAQAVIEVLDHPTLDEWWKQVMLTPDVAAHIDIPVLAITGFHDGDQAGCLYNWDLIESSEAKAATCRHLLIGPWRHAQMSTGKTAPMGEIDFDKNANVALPKAILRFFDAYMRGDEASRAKLPERCRLYTTGSNEWHQTSKYPPENSELLSWYLSSGGHANSSFGDGRLLFGPPSEESPDQLPVDWNVPVPAVGIGEDARDNEARFDVLVYTSQPLVEDVTVLGPVRAELHIAVNATDCDIVVRIEDVHPDGVVVNMTGEFGFGSFRARYRDGFDQEKLLTPGTPARLEFHICHMGHVFKTGHRVRVALCATVANVLDPNHHTGEPVKSAQTRFEAIETVFHDSKRPSRVFMPVLRTDPQQPQPKPAHLAEA